MVNTAIFAEMVEVEKDKHRKKSKQGHSYVGEAMQPMASDKRVNLDSEDEPTTDHQTFFRTGSGTPICLTCGKFHHGACRHARFICNRCGQTSHIKRECPQSASRSRWTWYALIPKRVRYRTPRTHVLLSRVCFMTCVRCDFDCIKFHVFCLYAPYACMIDVG